MHYIHYVGCALLALAPLGAAQAYPIELDKQLNGSEVSYSTQDIDVDMGGLTLRNLGETPATCSAVFRNGPEAPRTRRATLEPGETANLAVKFHRNIIKLRIQLRCAPK